MDREHIIKTILDCSFKVHTELGPGLLESSYEACLAYELKNCGLFIEVQKALPLIYNQVKLEIGYRIDLLVENEVIVEVKSVDALNDLHLAQILTYLKLSNKKIGILINFNVLSLKNGVKRVINKHFIEPTT
jgi:GxxExxY protein